MKGPSEPAAVSVDDLARDFDLKRARVLNYARRIGIPARRHFEKMLFAKEDARLLRREFREWLTDTLTIRCRECGDRFRRLNTTHLARHGLTAFDYKQVHQTPFVLSYDECERHGERMRGRIPARAFRWTADSIALLRREHGRRTIVAIARRLETTRAVIQRKAWVLGLPRRPRGWWTEEQDATLRRLAGTVPEDEIARRLGRSERSVRSRARDVLGVRLLLIRAWTPREDTVVRRDYGRISTRELAR